MNRTTSRKTGVNRAAALLAAGVIGVAAGSAGAESVRVSVENLAPDQGVYLTPTFVAFHDGGVDLYNDGEAVSSGFERLAEDGSTQFLADEVTGADGDAVVGALPGGLGAFPPPAVLGPGQTSTMTFDLDPEANRFLNYASMVIPSNDAFIGNDGSQSFEVFNEAGELQQGSVTIFGDQVLDAGTEVNNEQNAAFLNQATADAGTPESGVVTLHEGFNGSVDNPDDTPVNILGGTNPNGISFGEQAADFSRDGYQIARVSVAVVPTPAGVWMGLALLGVLGGGALWRARQRRLAV